MTGPRPIDVMIVGAQKSATTSLFRSMAQHPGVLAHAQSECTYFLSDDEYARGYAEAFRKYFGAGAPPDRVLLGKHVMLMYSAPAIARLATQNPATEVIVVLRHPVERAYSAYWYARRMGWERLGTFEAALAAEAERLREGWVRWRNCAYLSNSNYAPALLRLRETFGNPRVHVVMTEDFRMDRAAIFRHAFGWAGVDPSVEVPSGEGENRARAARSETVAGVLARFFGPGSTGKALARRLVPTRWVPGLRGTVQRLNERAFEPPPMAPDTRLRLLDHFRPLNDELGRLLGRDLSGWNA